MRMLVLTVDEVREFFELAVIVTAYGPLGAARWFPGSRMGFPVLAVMIDAFSESSTQTPFYADPAVPRQDFLRNWFYPMPLIPGNPVPVNVSPPVRGPGQPPRRFARRGNCAASERELRESTS